MASVPVLRSRTSASTTALRCSSVSLMSRCAPSWRSMSQTLSQPPLPNHSGYCSRASRATSSRTGQRMPAGLLADAVEGVAARVADRVTEILLDAQQLVVLGDAVGAGQRAGLDLHGVEAHGDVGDGAVLGFAGAV